MLKPVIAVVLIVATYAMPPSPVKSRSSDSNLKKRLLGCDCVPWYYLVSGVDFVDECIRCRAAEKHQEAETDQLVWEAEEKLKSPDVRIDH